MLRRQFRHRARWFYSARFDRLRTQAQRTQRREENRDGHEPNYSENFGVEGATGDPAIVLARRAKQKAMMLTLLLSAGTPMLAMGDEFGRTQLGNNNAYCQNFPMPWPGKDSVADESLRSFVARLTQLRARLSRDCPPEFLCPARTRMVRGGRHDLGRLVATNGYIGSHCAHCTRASLALLERRGHAWCVRGPATFRILSKRCFEATRIMGRAKIPGRRYTRGEKRSRRVVLPRARSVDLLSPDRGSTVIQRRIAVTPVARASYKSYLMRRELL